MSEPITATPSGVRLVAVKPDGTEIDVTEGVMALYDLVIGSMDWGSGFLTVEEALPVAEIAEVCGFAEWEAAEAYIEEQKHSKEQQEFIQQRRGLGASNPYYFAGDGSHDHVWSSVGRCMWPVCQVVEGASDTPTPPSTV